MGNQGEIDQKTVSYTNQGRPLSQEDRRKLYFRVRYLVNKYTESTAMEIENERKWLTDAASNEEIKKERQDGERTRTRRKSGRTKMIKARVTSEPSTLMKNQTLSKST